MKGLERWQGKVALVTGASSGIGAATARAMARAGLRVVLAARRLPVLQGLEAELTGAGAQATAVRLDLASEDSVKAMFGAIRERWGGVDAVVNCAGVAWHGLVETGNSEQWRQMTDINVLGFAFCLREAVAALKDRPLAHIISISSMSAHRIKPGGNIAYYGASKHAMRAIVDGLRMEMVQAGTPIKVSMISPGLVDTEMYETAVPASLGLDAKDRDRFLDPAWVADAVLWILSTPPHVQVHDMFLIPIAQG